MARSDSLQLTNAFAAPAAYGRGGYAPAAPRGQATHRWADSYQRGWEQPKLPEASYADTLRKQMRPCPAPPPKPTA